MVIGQKHDTQDYMLLELTSLSLCPPLELAHFLHNAAVQQYTMHRPPPFSFSYITLEGSQGLHVRVVTCQRPVG